MFVEDVSNLSGKVQKLKNDIYKEEYRDARNHLQNAIRSLENAKKSFISIENEKQMEGQMSIEDYL